MVGSMTDELFNRVRDALLENGFTQQDDYLLAHGASVMSESSHEIIHVDTLRTILAASASAEAKGEQQDARYIVIGYGESDYPQATFVNERDALLNAVLGMIYMHPNDAPAYVREGYRQDLENEDEWSHDGRWSTEFEIGGIVVYDTGERVAPKPQQPAERIGGVHLSIATGIDLDAIGDFYETPRNGGEPDADYRKRIQSIKANFEAWLRDRSQGN
jgi:hypothetical protein